jgi:tRNA (guanine-N7-)-methyltransferase
LVKQLARELKPGARVYLQSDVGSLTEDMRDKFERYGSEYFGLDADLYDVEAAAAKAAEAAKEPVEPVDEKDDGWRSGWAHAGWLDENPIGIPSEREVQTLGEGLPVFRVMLRRNEKAF